MSGSPRSPGYTLAVAERVALELVELLADSCVRVEIAGSIRRRRPTVYDIDVVAVPRVVTMRDMFGDLTSTGVDVLGATLDELCGAQTIVQWRGKNQQTCWGPRLKRGAYRGIDVQIQSYEPDNFGLALLIRTGPSAYSHVFVTPRSETAVLRDRDGVVVGKRPGLLPPGFSIERGFRLYRAGAAIPTPEERDVYDALSMRYLDPTARR